MSWNRVLRGMSLALLAVLMLQLSSASSVQAQADDAIHFEDYVLDTTDYSLPNGMRVILAQDTSAPVVAVDIWYHVGGANDPAGRSGFAHLFEHMMFEGSANIPNGQWDALLEPIGARHNAYTQDDMTGYWEVAPANELPRVLWMEADRMRSLKVTEDAYVNQRDVVIQEYNQRVGNQPYGAANLRLFTQATAGYPPYARPTIGSVEDLMAAPFADVQAFHDRYYKPNNATLVVVGDIDLEQAKALIQANFANIPAGEPVTPILDEYPLPAEFPVLRTDETTGCKIGTEETIIDPQIRIPRLGMTVIAPPRGNPDFYALDILASILSSGDASRLQQDIVQQGKAAAAFMGLDYRQGLTILYAAALPNQGGGLDEMAALMQDEFAKVRTEGVTEAELARVKQQVLAGSLTSYRASAYDTAEWLQDAVLTFGSPDSILTELNMYKAVTAEDVQRVAQEYLCDKPMNYQRVLQSGEESLDDTTVETPAATATPSATELPAPLEVSAAEIAALPAGTVTTDTVPAPLGPLTSNFPPFESFTLDNGLDVIFVPQHEVPKLQLQLVVGGANPAVGPDQQGIADMMADLITKGTFKKSAATIANEIESVGGSISASAALEYTSVSVDSLTTDTKLAFDLLSEVARYAVFPQSEFDVAKQQTLTLLEQDAVDPTSMANREFGRVLYPNHPYGYITTPETVGNLTRNDIRAFHRTFYRPNNALLIVVGDVTVEEARAETKRAFGMWQPAEVPDFLDYPETAPADTSVIYLVDRPGSEQATIHIGNIAIDARNPDRYALAVVNAALGSGSSSRLYLNLREDKGYTYGVYSRFAQPNSPASFRVLGDFNKDNAGAAIVEILAELKRIRTEPMSAQELSDAKGKLVGGFALAMEDPSTFANQLASRALTGVPIEELNVYLDRLEAVTADEAEAAAAKYINSDSPLIVVVGDAATLQPQLEKIKPVLVVDADGDPVQQ